MFRFGRSGAIVGGETGTTLSSLLDVQSGMNPAHNNILMYDATTEKWGVGSNISSNTVSVDTISENTANAGVTVDGVELKDSAVGNVQSLKIVASNGNHVNIQPPTSITANYDLKLPTQQGASGTYLTQDGAGNTSWATVNLSGGNSQLSQLNDVNGSMVPASNDLLAYDSTNSYWRSTKEITSVNVQDLEIRDNTTNKVTLTSPATVVDYTISLPAAAPTVKGSKVVSDTSGNLRFSSWTQYTSETLSTVGSHTVDLTAFAAGEDEDMLILVSANASYHDNQLHIYRSLLPNYVAMGDIEIAKYGERYVLFTITNPSGSTYTMDVIIRNPNNESPNIGMTKFETFTR